jgi:hypothetical protein
MYVFIYDGLQGLLLRRKQVLMYVYICMYMNIIVVIINKHVEVCYYQYYLYLRVHRCIKVYLHLCILIYIHVHTYIYVYIHIDIRIYTYIHIYMNIYIYMYKQYIGIVLTEKTDRLALTAFLPDSTVSNAINSGFRINTYKIRSLKVDLYVYQCVSVYVYVRHN